MDVTTDQMFPNVTLVVTDADERPARVDGVPVWASSDETVLLVTASADGMSASVSTVAPGTARVTVSADADLGEGVVEKTGRSEDVNVTQGVRGMAAVLTLDLGAPVDK